MDEKIYRTMKGTGAMNIVLGIIAMVTGIVSGTLLDVYKRQGKGPGGLCPSGKTDEAKHQPSYFPGAGPCGRCV